MDTIALWLMHVLPRPNGLRFSRADPDAMVAHWEDRNAAVRVGCNR